MTCMSKRFACEEVQIGPPVHKNISSFEEYFIKNTYNCFDLEHNFGHSLSEKHNYKLC